MHVFVCMYVCVLIHTHPQTLILTNILEKHVRGRYHPSSSLQLQIILTVGWVKVPPKNLQALYESIPRRTQNVISKKSVLLLFKIYLF